MITFATLLWDANAASQPFSRAYDEAWADKLYRGVARRLSLPFRFVVFTDRFRAFDELGIEQELLATARPDYGCCIEPFRLDTPSIIVGLDTVITGSLDAMATWCLTGDRVALPRSPGKPYACNGIALVPAGQRRIHDDWRGENDMEWLRDQPHVFIDDLFPGQAVSFKCDVRPNGLGDARVVYFHGPPKMPDLADEPWIAEHWR